MVALAIMVPGAGYAAEPGAEQIDLARKVLIASGNDARVAAIDRGLEMQNVLTQALKAHFPDVDESWQPAIADAVQAELKTQADQLFSENVKIYATDFTAAELNEMLAFYASPGGRALVAKTPAIVQEKMAWGRAQGQASFARMIDSVCAKKACPEH
ncbi:DUF2059 domain-containing protein [Sphingomonas sp. CGMCC 1.13654]|uniref:DUF2059 domain-containing protein n=1 Tax=Sphingomonas chungangi TaxID=2683589 RepID=A0A838L3S9_9SPHN|nr:DUF2059 domain-containing protein [Sphingomonas chungangi]MBA2932866.1 DUF2059 domain-containing protein [Sphingomonas chungangi]MVW56486.1 DUF2059 domain-containing protein [Sphingomonas chungangi]